MEVPILKQGQYLIATIQSALTDHDLMQLRDALVERVGKFRARGVIVDVTALDVMSLASFNRLDGTMTRLGVGNVEEMLLRADAGQKSRQEHLLLRGGVVGGALPALGGPPQRIADDILAKYSWGTDDALVLVARYAGGRGRDGKDAA